MGTFRDNSAYKNGTQPDSQTNKKAPMAKFRSKVLLVVGHEPPILLPSQVRGELLSPETITAYSPRERVLLG